jgi:1,4-dihydroxy-2-naphthoyl-CoA hydrolase
VQTIHSIQHVPQSPLIRNSVLTFLQWNSRPLQSITDRCSECFSHRKFMLPCTQITVMEHKFHPENMISHLGIEILKNEPGRVEARMPVDKRTIQPFGLLHGGASAVLAETIGSIGAHEAVKAEGGVAVGLELNINHLKSATTDFVYGIGEPIHLGRSTQVWDVKIRDHAGSLIAIARLTVMVKYAK